MLRAYRVWTLESFKASHRRKDRQREPRIEDLGL